MPPTGTGWAGRGSVKGKAWKIAKQKLCLKEIYENAQWAWMMSTPLLRPLLSLSLLMLPKSTHIQSSVNESQHKARNVRQTWNLSRGQGHGVRVRVRMRDRGRARTRVGKWFGQLRFSTRTTMESTVERWADVTAELDKDVTLKVVPATMKYKIIIKKMPWNIFHFFFSTELGECI